MKLAALLALLGVAACAGPSETSAIRAPQQPGPSAVASHALRFKVFTAGQTQGFPASAGAVDLALGPDGSMWFTDDGTPAIGRVATDGTITEYTSGLPYGARPYSIVPGPDGNMWFSDFRGVAIGEVTPQGAITEFDAPQYTNSSAMGIAFGARGEPYFIGFGSQPLLAHLTPQGNIAATLLPASITPFGALSTDAGENLWFVVTGAQSRGVLYEQRTHARGFSRRRIKMQRIELPCCPNQAPKSIAVGADGNPWFTTLDFGHRNSPASYLGTLSAGKVRLIRIRHKGLSEVAYPSGIAVAKDGLWITGGDPFTDNGALWHVGANGKQTAYNLPYDPLALAVDAAGDPWFSAKFSGAPSRIVEVLR
jgi:streptogramin lyase